MDPTVISHALELVNQANSLSDKATLMATNSSQLSAQSVLFSKASISHADITSEHYSRIEKIVDHVKEIKIMEASDLDEKLYSLNEASKMIQPGRDLLEKSKSLAMIGVVFAELATYFSDEASKVADQADQYITQANEMLYNTH